MPFLFVILMGKDREMRERDRIINQFCRFVAMMRDNDWRDMEAVFHQDASIEFSTVGKHRGIKEISQALSWDQSVINRRKAKAGNIVVRHTKEKASMISYGYFLYAADTEKGFHPVEYGGRFYIQFSKSDEWKIDRILFDLDWEKGNTYFLKGWTLMDQQVLMGHEQMFVSETEAPWLDFESFEDDRTGEEKLIETFVKYTVGEDTVNWALFHSVLDQDVHMYLTPTQSLTGSREVLKWMKVKRAREAAWEHFFRYRNIVWNENGASMEINRIEPHRLGTKVLHPGNFEGMWYSGTYRIEFCRTGEEWRIRQVSLEKGIFYEENNSQEILI